MQVSPLNRTFRKPGKIAKPGIAAVMQGGELIPLESGQFVRVRMTRSNLIPFGIPFDQECRNETIQADALLSNDGLARAIRLDY